MTSMNKGLLYIVATPIGNMQDITIRALEVLKGVDYIAAEDTRMSRKILQHYEFHKELVSYHDHSQGGKRERILSDLEVGKSVALISDGGTPLISDPGFKLLREAIARGIRVESIPGPCAAINALVLSGMPTDAFIFVGFLSRSPQKRRKMLRFLSDETRTIVCYESPHRIMKMLDDVEAICGDRPIALLREMTKKFEEHVRGRVSEVREVLNAKTIKGEFVVVIGGKE